MSGLPREILKWLQSLDLSYSVKNVKRDFANGFLIAEIFSRYYPADIQMHSFDNGIALKRRIDNWQQLQKFFKKRGIPIEWNECESVLHSKPDAAVPFLLRVYQVLTSKTISFKAPSIEADVDLPPFALPTASSAVKTAIPASELAIHPDSTYGPSRSAQVLGEHYQQIRAEKAKDPQRYIPTTTSTSKRSPGGAGGKDSTSHAGHDGLSAASPNSYYVPSPSTANGDAHSAGGDPSIQFREVQVKRLDGGLSQLRAARDLNHAQDSSSSKGGMKESSSSAYGNEAGMAQMNLNPHQMGLLQAVSSNAGGSSNSGVSVLVVLNKTVESVLQRSEDIKALDASKETIVSFLEVAAAEDLPTSSVREVFLALYASAASLSEAMNSHPREFFRGISTLSAVFQAPLHSAVFVEGAELLVRIGRESVRRAPAPTWRLFAEHGLPAMTRIMKRAPPKRHALLRVLHAYCPEDAESQMNAVQTLQEALSDADVFLHCISLLAHVLTQPQEPTSSSSAHPRPSSSGEKEKLLDVLVYYAVVGMGHASPALRAAAISLLPAVAPDAPASAAALLPKVAALQAKDKWWEIQAQIGTLYAALLITARDALAADQVAQLIDLSCSFLDQVVHPLVMQIVLAEFAPLVSPQYPRIVTSYMTRLLAAPASVRASLLTADPLSLALVTPPMCPYGHLQGVLTRWHSLAAAQAVAGILQKAQLENMESEHVTVLRGCLRMESVPEETIGWGQVFEQLKYYLFAALCDPHLTGPAAECLIVFFDMLQERALSTLPTLVGSLKLVFAGDADADGLACQQVVAQFLVTLYRRGEPFSPAMQQLARKLPEDILRAPRLKEFAQLAMR